jgi:hypothetical protein
LSVLAAGLLWVNGCGLGKGTVDENRFTALGKVMAEQTTQLCEGKASVVLVVSQNDHQQVTPAGLTFDAFGKALGKTVQVNSTEIVQTPQLLMPMSDPLTVAEFSELLRKHSGSDYLVSFVGVPPMTPAQIAQLPSPRPRVVAVVTHNPPTKAMFAGRVVCLAALFQGGSSPAPSGGSAKEIFEASYRLVSSETTGLPSR